MSQQHTSYPLTTAIVHFSTDPNIYTNIALHPPLSNSQAPNSKLSSVLNNLDLTERKYNDIAARIPISPQTKRLMTKQCITNNSELVPDLKAHFVGECPFGLSISLSLFLTNSGLDINDPPEPTNQSLERKVLADQQALDVATKKYREAAEAFHFWDTEIWKRERSAEVEKK
ncbi:unnamed protein product [Fusarium graminearum]|nr:unnamed protein product [Fusarium graminearum]